MATARKSTRKMGSRKADSGDLGGFTIIEVVLVLAIAGLIFLMVFIALPALQRSQRDTQRRNDLARVATAITQYQTNNNGKLPNTGGQNLEPTEDEELPECGQNTPAACFIRNYMNSVNAAENEFQDPDGWYYGLAIKSAKGVTTDLTPIQATGDAQSDTGFDHMITIYTHASCEGENAVESTNARDYAILYKLEGSGTYCSDNGGNGAHSSTDDGE